jgi:3-phosphoglycerate kinase
MKQLTDFNFNEKTVLVRCDFNVSFSEKNEISDDYRIEAPIDTINYLIKEKAKIVLLSHFTGPEDQKILVQKKLEEKLKKSVILLENLKNRNKINQGEQGNVFLSLDLRKNKGEEENSYAFAQELSLLGEIYVNEAFSVCHRNHASIVELPGIMPSCAGLQLVQEVKTLSKIASNPWKPLVVIVGGAKVESKIRVIQSFLDKADHLLLGGKLVNKVLVIKRMLAYQEPLPEEITEEVKKIDLTSPKIHFPLDVIVSTNPKGEFYTRITGPGLIRKEESIFDIGPETINIYSRIIKEAKMIVWAGPLGLFEEKKFEKGTKEIARAVSLNHQAFKIVGGGDTGVALTKFGFRKSVDHISTGGGAMLDFFSEKKLPGLKALGYYD